MSSVNRRWCLMALLLVCVAPGCKHPVEKEAEKRVLALLPEYIGPAGRYRIVVKGESTGAVMRGRLRAVQIEGEQVQATPDLLLEQLNLDFDEVSVDTRARRLQNIGKAIYQGRLSYQVLDAYVRRRHPDIAGLKIELRGDRILVSARPDAIGLVEKPFGINLPGKLNVPITVEGKLEPRNGVALDFVPEKATIAAVPIPQAALDLLAAQVNPIVQFSGFRIPIQVEETSVRGGYLLFSGTIRPDDLIKMQ